MFVHIQTHSVSQSHAYHTEAVSSCGFQPYVSTVMLYVLATGVAACVFFFLCLLAGAPDGSVPAWFPHRGRRMFSV